MTYTQAAVERAMKVYEVLVQALKERQPWIHVAEVLGVSARTVRRLRWRYEHDGFEGLFDHRRRTPSPRCAPVAEVQRVVRLYAERYHGFNVRHFHQIVRREHGVTLSYSFVKKALQAAHLVGRRRPRGRHRRRREPRPCFGELLHLDGSLHGWLALVPDALQTLMAVVDDATKQVLYAQLGEPGESADVIMTALRAVLETHGIPGALYTDRAGWAVYTPTSGSAPDRSKLTQVGRAPASHRAALGVVGPPLPRPVYRAGAAAGPAFREYRDSGPRGDRASWRHCARAPSTPIRESGSPLETPRLRVSGQITCQTRAARSLVNDSDTSPATPRQRTDARAYVVLRMVPPG